MNDFTISPISVKVHKGWNVKILKLTQKILGINNSDLSIFFNKSDDKIILVNKSATISGVVGAGLVYVLDLIKNKAAPITQQSLIPMSLFGSGIDIGPFSKYIYISGVEVFDGIKKNVVYRINIETQERDMIFEDGLKISDNYGFSISICESAKLLAISSNAVSNDTLLPTTSNLSLLKNTGAVFIYDNNTDIKLKQTITPKINNCFLFGSNIKMSANGCRLFISARLSSDIKDGNKSTNIIYCYEKNVDNNWEYHSELLIANKYLVDSFGYSLECDYLGHNVIVGVPDGYRRRSLDVPYGSGWVCKYIYQDNAWREFPILPVESKLHHKFGFNVSINSDCRRAVINGLVQNTDIGIFYLYNKDSHNEFKPFELFDSKEYSDIYGRYARISNNGRTIISTISSNHPAYKEDEIQLILFEETK